MTYEDVVFAWNGQADENNQYDTLSDRERIEFALSLAGKVEKQEPVAWVSQRCVGDVEWNSAFTLLNGAELFAAPQPCPECEKLKSEVGRLKFELNNLAGAQTNISVVAQLEKLKAELAAERRIYKALRPGSAMPRPVKLCEPEPLFWFGNAGVTGSGEKI